MTTTDAGVTVPFIVRIGRGTMNRGIHEIAVLADPSKGWAPWATGARPGWNRKHRLRHQRPVDPVAHEDRPPLGARIAWRSGRVSHGGGLGEVAIIDRMQFNVIEEHCDFRSWVIRNRIHAAWGDHHNQVIWRYKSSPSGLSERTFDTMIRWLMAVEADASSATLREKIIANKPAEATDSCWRADRQAWSTDAVYCNTGLAPHMDATVVGEGPDAVPMPTVDEWPVYRDTRVAAGEPLTSDVLQCELKPLNPADDAVSFTPAQWARLVAAFPRSACDWSQPGRGQDVSPATWQTFMAGPGGGPARYCGHRPGAAPRQRLRTGPAPRPTAPGRDGAR